jgi:hypothetical protein
MVIRIVVKEDVRIDRTMAPSCNPDRESRPPETRSSVARSQRRGLWSKARRVWAILGSIAFVVFTTWCVIAYRATEDARQALKSGDAGVVVIRGVDHWSFRRTLDGDVSRRIGLLFFPGALVDPVAYARY